MAKLLAATDATPEEIVRAMARQGKSSGASTTAKLRDPLGHPVKSSVRYLRERIAADLRDFELFQKKGHPAIGLSLDEQASQD